MLRQTKWFSLHHKKPIYDLMFQVVGVRPSHGYTHDLLLGFWLSFDWNEVFWNRWWLW
ncbi:hypothetical protein HanRHA438_Chr07g0316011 [Helianthus annuus]|nr:hypothetical protein HanRHA438_Chr07g0316011 [Helianthus annuus]